MKIISLAIPDVKLIEPDVFGDNRGFFMETYRADLFKEAGIPTNFVQDNMSSSRKGVLRGLHFQKNPYSQGKLVRVVRGEVFDVAVDLRKGSPYFGKWVGDLLSEENKKSLYVPQGFAHGFCVVSDEAVFHYKCTEFYHPEAEGGLRYDDPTVNVEWPLPDLPKITSPKDEKAPFLENIDCNFTY
ncbi:dTDP-4-dehydrorhamnose 3,5-epimerase [bacterium]|jgi:dTDP-4-dehydrorhamnose 3,5-epimerase|nr:dTDP-4-dehydrorhamnose 3,5-epimerase [bacterium]MBR4465952.1 dTDP-4-dehydrorhamnose 3,5-epimerase [bacterium]